MSLARSSDLRPSRLQKQSKSLERKLNQKLREMLRGALAKKSETSEPFQTKKSQRYLRVPEYKFSPRNERATAFPADRNIFMIASL